MTTRRHESLALVSGAAIGTLGGLVGLGGGEFRLPVLTSVFGYATRAAVPMNLVVSLITLVASLLTRACTLSLAAVAPFAIEAVALGVGGIAGARWSANLLTRISDHRLERSVAVLLAAVGVILILEAFLTANPAGLMPREPVALAASGLILGLVIGVVAALLGVAGGELLIPTLLFVYGADIRTAGTATLMISIVTVASGLWRYGRLDALPDRQAMRLVAAPMGFGSIVGAIVGGMLAGILPTPAVKVFLGIVLIAASTKNMWRGGDRPQA